MSHNHLTGVALAALLGAGALFTTVGASQAAMAPMPLQATAAVHHVDCAVGAHIGPLGGCILGTDDTPPPVIEHRSADVPPGTQEKTVRHDANGCTTKTVKENDGMGNSESHSASNCD
jgi:hypothetical protein